MQELLWPTRCIVCDEPGELLCANCRVKLPWIAQRYACPNCGAPFGSMTCTECGYPKGEPWKSRSCICALPLEGPAHTLVTTHKDRSERRLAAISAAIMATALDEASSWLALDGVPRFSQEDIDALCFVPATASAYARRGFDHMEFVARNLEGMISVPLVDALARPEGKDQRKLNKEQRKINTAHTIQVVQDISGCNLLLIDDVITTGASIQASTQALLDHGAKSVSVCVLARTW